MKVAVQLILTFLLNASWQIALVAGFALVCDWLLRGTVARYRHGVWVAALLLSLTLPALSLSRVVKTLMIVSPPPVKVAGGSEGFVSTYSPELDSPQSNLVTAEAEPPPPAPARRGGLGLWTSPIHLNSSLAYSLIAIYGLFLFSRAGQLFRAWRRTRTIIQTANSFELSAHIEAMIKGCKIAIGVTRVRILGSPSVPVPITVGILNPLIILPDRLLQDVDEEVLTTAIGHELVHVARRDYLLNLIYEFIYLPLSFHPAAALVRRRIRQTRELCCDEAVATKLLRPETYARSLVRLIGSASLRGRRAADTAIGISESDILEVRIMSLLKTRTLTARSRRLSLVVATLLLVTPCIAATSFALSFEIDRQETNPTAQEQSLKRERQVQERQREELKRAVQQLEEKMRVAPKSKRAEIEERLREVQENLKLHEMAVQQFYQEKQESLKKAQELREVLAQVEAKKSKADEAQIERLRQELATIEAQNSAEEARVREERQKLVQSYQASLDRKAKVIYRVDPEYSEDARAKKIEGTVLLGFTIDHEGLPQGIQVKRSLYPSLDQKAIEAVRKWRFEPALKNGQPVSMWVNVEVYFALDQRTKEDLEKIAAQQREEQTGYAIMRRRQQDEVRTQEERSRKQAELTRGATLSMDRAIQIATSQVPGKVLACSLGRDGDKVFYHVVIIGGDGDKTTATYVWVSATDGQILKTEKEERKEEFLESRNDVLTESGPNASIQGGVLNGKASSLPPPAYPAIARQAHASGAVNVQVLISEGGEVIAAHAVSGHPLLQAAAVTAARQAKFTPTRMNGEPVRVSGLLVYNFVTQ